MSIYFEGENFKTELFGKDASNAASTFVFIQTDGRVDEKRSVKSAQLRKFYNEFKALEKKFASKSISAKPGQEEETVFRTILPLVKMAKSKVAYASNPANRKVPKEFADWLNKNIDAINSAKEFKAFLLHFEAVVGFCYGMGLKN